MTHRSQHPPAPAATVSPAGEPYVTGSDIPDGKFTAVGTVMNSYRGGEEGGGSCGGFSYPDYDFALARYTAPTGLEERRFVQQEKLNWDVHRLRHMTTPRCHLDGPSTGTSVVCRTLDAAGCFDGLAVVNPGPASGGTAFAQTAILLPNHDILLAGAYWASSQSTPMGILAEVTLDGELSSTFGPNGQGWIADASIPLSYTMAVQLDGRIVAVGWMHTGTGAGEDFAVAVVEGGDRPEERLWAVHDANWTITSTTGVMGNVTQRMEYDPYGGVTYLTANYQPSTNDYELEQGFQGLRQDSITGWWDARNRWLIPNLQTWNRMDSHPSGPYVDGMTGYGVLRGNPVNGVDPMGLYGSGIPGFSYSSNGGWGFWNGNPPLTPPANTTTSGGASVYAVPPGVPVPPSPGVNIPLPPGLPTVPPPIRAVAPPVTPSGASPWDIELQQIRYLAELWNVSDGVWNWHNQCDDQATKMSEALRARGPWKYWTLDVIGGRTEGIGAWGWPHLKHHVTVVKPLPGNPSEPVVLDGFHGPQRPNKYHTVTCESLDAFAKNWPYWTNDNFNYRSNLGVPPPKGGPIFRPPYGSPQRNTDPWPWDPSKPIPPSGSPR